MHNSLRILLVSQRLWRSDNAMEIVGPVRVVHQYVNMPEQTAEFHNETTGKLEEVSNVRSRRRADRRIYTKTGFIRGISFRAQVHGCLPAMGYSFAAGTTDGPGSFAFRQGTKTSNPLWNAVRNFLAAPTEDDIRCHGAKPILLATGRVSVSIFLFLFFLYSFSFA